MRSAIILLSMLIAAPALAQEATDTMAAGMPPGIMISTSIGINAPLAATDRAGKTAEEDAYRQSLYARSVAECDALLASIAKTCVVTSVNVSTQLNASPGQPDFLYASSSITMQVELK